MTEIDDGRGFESHHPLGLAVTPACSSPHALLQAFRRSGRCGQRPGPWAAANQQTASVVVRVRADFDTACEDIVWSGKNVSPSSSNARLTGPGALTVETIVGRHM